MSRSSATVLSAACLALTAASADCGHHQGSSLAFLPAVPTPPAVRPHGSLSIPCRRTLPATSGTSFFLPSTQPHGPLSVRCAEDSSGGEAQADGLPTEHEAGRSNSPGYPIPSLGRLVITDLELNVPRRAGKKALGDGLLGADEPQIQDDSQRPGAGLKPTAGLGAAVGLLAGGPVGALFGAAASVLTSRKNNVAGATVRTAAKAAGAMWGVGSQAASKVEAGPVGDVVKTGLREVESVFDSLGDEAGKGKKRGGGA